jgi:3'-phosphoadenosine 5'-phosphosulfate sulfotransferase (PAPS reductase)/FAD synthetase
MTHEMWQLKQLQSLPLEVKIEKTKQRIREWYEHWEGDVNVSFSGGKDSTVLLHIVREMYPDVEAVFADTGLEYPEIREFVKTIDNVTWVKPATTFVEVIKKYGYPVISKEVAKMVYYAKKSKVWATNRFNGEDPKGNRDEFKQRYKKYKYLINAPFCISSKCCEEIKKKPLKVYQKRTRAFVGTTADESGQRKQAWLKTGCNAFDTKPPISKPLSFWKEQDILQYIKKFNIPYSTIYGEIEDDLEGQISLFGDDTGRPLHTTGEQRTGCMFCMFGCHLEKEPNRFQRMKITHPKMYDYCIRPTEENGLGLGKVLDYIGVKY